MSSLSIAVCMPRYLCVPTVACLTAKRRDTTLYVIDHETLKVQPDAKRCTVLLADSLILAKIVPQMPNLQFVQSTWAGVDVFFRSMKSETDFKKPSWKLCRMATYGPILTEYVVGQMLSWERKFFDIKKNQDLKVWDQLAFAFYRPLSSLVIAILGLGSAGGEIAKICKQLGMTVHGLQGRKHSSEKTKDVDVWRSRDELPLLLSECDYLVNVLPSTPETCDLLGNDMFKHCSAKKAVFINIGRGDIVSEKDLILALDNCYLGGAILDVFDVEPLPSDSKLWSNPKVVITPHIAGFYLPNLGAEFFLKNLSRFEAGDSLLSEVDWNLEY